MNANSSVGTGGYLARVNTPTYLVGTTSYSIQTLVGDAFSVGYFLTVWEHTLKSFHDQIYRVWLVWSRDKRVVFPLVIYLLASTGDSSYT